MSEPTSEDSIQTVRRVAALARLEITDVEAEQLGLQFTKILRYFHALAELDVEGIEPMTGGTCGTGGTGADAELRDVVREDRPGPGFPVERLLAEAPERVDDFYAVPKTIVSEKKS